MVPGSGALDMIPIKSVSEALSAPIVRVPALPQAAYAQDVNGAGLWDTIKKGATNVVNWLKDAHKDQRISKFAGKFAGVPVIGP